MLLDAQTLLLPSSAAVRPANPPPEAPPTHVGVADEASPVRQEHHAHDECGNWFVGLEGGVHCMAQELERDFIFVRRMAEGMLLLLRTERASVHAPKNWSRWLVLKYVMHVQTKSRGLENLSVETMHHVCRADRMWGGVVSALSIDSPAHIQDDFVESGLGTLNMFAQLPVLLL
eukprot:1115347-Pelagomonas_calceolata.AAC.1